MLSSCADIVRSVGTTASDCAAAITCSLTARHSGGTLRACITRTLLVDLVSFRMAVITFWYGTKNVGGDLYANRTTGLASCTLSVPHSGNEQALFVLCMVMCLPLVMPLSGTNAFE